MASERSKALWEISIPLPQFIMEQARDRITAAPVAETGIGWRFLELLNRTTNVFIAPGNAIEQTRKAIRRGTLVATGIRVSSSPSRTPVLIAPATIARGRIRPFENALVGADFHYTDVRVIRRADIPSFLRSARPTQGKRRAEISKLISALHKSGQLTGLRKQQAFAVREALAQAGVENVGTSKTVERLIRQALKLENCK